MPISARFLAVIAVTLGAQIVCHRAGAGEISYANGKGYWKSTQCTAPVPPKSDYSDAAAVNAAVYQLTELINAYNQCLHDEVQKDLNQSNTMAIETVRHMQDEAVASIAHYRQHLAEQPPAASAPSTTAPAAKP